MTHGILDPKSGKFAPIRPVHSRDPDGVATAVATAQGNANLHQKPTLIAERDDVTGEISTHGRVLPSVNGGSNTISSIVSGGGSPPPGVRTKIQARSPFRRG
jgi:hypothetical protein